jgi:phosphoribosylformylglycinamidine (FGAM) synthase PurS component
MIFEAAIDLTIPDNTAYSVRVALAQLGYAGLERVERTEVFRLSIVDEQTRAEDIARALTRAEVLFNPNKHRLSYAVDDASSFTIVGEWEAIVADRDSDTKRLQRVLCERFGIRGLERLDRSIAWRLYEAGCPASKDKLEWACRALLCNPYSQSSTVRMRPNRTPVGDGAVAVET